MVHLEEDLWQPYRDEGFTVLGVSLMESPPLVASWIELKGLSYPIVIDPDASTYLLFSSSPIPYNVLLDRDGVLRYGGYGFDLELIRGIVLDLLEEDGSSAGASSWTELKALF